MSPIFLQPITAKGHAPLVIPYTGHKILLSIPVSIEIDILSNQNQFLVSISVSKQVVQNLMDDAIDSCQFVNSLALFGSI